MAALLHEDLADLPIPDEKVVCVLRKAGEHSTIYHVIGLLENLPEEAKAGAIPWRLTSYRATELPQALLDQFLVEGLPEYLHASATRKLHYVVSTHSGTGLALDFYHLVLEPLLEAVYLCSTDSNSMGKTIRGAAVAATGSSDVTVTTDEGSIRRVARGLAGETGEHTVVLLSGDGGVIEMLNGVAGDDLSDGSDGSLPLIVLLPFGTGNALFHSLHKPLYSPSTSSSSASSSPLVQALRTLLSGQAAPLPSFKAAFSPGSRTISYTSPEGAPREAADEQHTDSVTHLHGAIVASYGFHAQLVWESDTPEYRKHGAKRFGMVAEELLGESHAYHATVEITPADGSTTPRKVGTSSGRHAYVLATLVSNLERTFAISPAGRPLDGRLRLVHFGATTGDIIMDVMKAAYDEGRHVGMTWEGEDGATEGVAYEEIEEVRVTMEEEDTRWRKVCVDGTIVEVPRGGSMSVRREAERLRVLVDRTVLSSRGVQE